MYTTLEQEIKEEIGTVRNLAITHDSWTSLGNESYDTVTAHYIINGAESWQLQSKVLSTLKVEGSHTSEKIVESLSMVRLTWNLPEPIAVTDSAAIEVKALSTLGWTRLACTGHNINLAVKAGLAVAEVAKIVAKGRNLVSFFHRSPSATTLLKTKQESQLDKGQRKLSLLQDVATRWNSTVDMLCRLCLLMSPLHATILDSNAPARVKALQSCLYSFEEQVVVEKLIKALEPCKKATELVSGEGYPTLHQVLLCIIKITKAWEEEEGDSTAIKNFKKSRRDNFWKRNYEAKEYKMAAALHPRTKQLQFLPEADRYSVRELMKKEAIEISGAPAPPAVQVKVEQPEAGNPAEPALPADPALPGVPADPAPAAGPALPNLPDLEPEEPEEPPAKKSKVDDDDDWLDEVIFMGTEISDKATGVLQEVDRYLLEPPSMELPMKWWMQRACLFPTLSIMAKKYLCVPASSVPSERIFSLAGNIVTKKRCSLSPEAVNELIFLNKNRRVKKKK